MSDPAETCIIENTPHDPIQYREYKIILHPNHFQTEQAFRDFWKIAKETAKKFGVGLEKVDNAFVNQVREVLFYDTENFDLYRNHFIVRLRTFYKDGWPRGIPELTVKFRHPDFATAAAVDVRPATPGGLARIKFKEEFLPIRESLGGIRSIFSHNCVLAMPRAEINVLARDLQSAFPATKAVQTSEDTPVTLVNDFAVEEVQVDLARLHFGHGLNAKATLAVWRDRKHEQPLCGEFAFQCKFESVEKISKVGLQRADDFYRNLQIDAFEWVTLGTTKTAMIYGLNKKGTAHAE